MKRLTLLWSSSLCCAALLAGCASQPAADTSVAPSPAAHAPASAPEVLREDERLAHYRLPNGLEVIVKPDRRAPTAIHMLWVRAGAIDEVDGTSGIAHMLEHMMFKGTEKLAPGEFSRRVAELGGQDNAFTSRDYTGYYQQVPASRLEDVMALEADRFQHNRWPDEEFLREVEVVKEERRMRTDDQPRAKLYEQLMAVTYLASQERRPIIGWMDDIEHFTADDVRAFYHRWYVPANAAVVVVGNVEPRAVLALAERYYGPAAAAPLPTRKPTAEPPQQGPRRLVLRDRAEQPVLLMAFKVPPLANIEQPSEADREALALTALSAVLSGYDGARLDRALTRGAGRIADSADSSAGLSGRSGNGLFVLSGIPAAGRSNQELEAGLRQAVAEIAAHGISAQELQRVVTQWSAITVYGQDSMYAQASELGSNWVQGWPLDATDRLLALLREVTPGQVQAVAQKYFGDDALTVAELLPQAAPVAATGTNRPAPTARPVQPAAGGSQQ
ncbi:insulinase family protein [Corticibacter populi]|uniref:Insulinase family protein n=1 Tax=Corticibacter populi TaxID=1550736 RepID=A0A3M6QTQ5_9BURK|nr:pitrilysin family protein [Corticibacter populi]RMX05929.1 insulinase family protein [Corticibacter populi]RZS30748.1 zinc protease [Corticibacter populi]